MKKNNNILSVSAILLLFLVACQQAASTTDRPSENSLTDQPDANTKVNEAKIKLSPADSEQQQWVYATVKHVNLEGGFYGLLAANGDKLLALNLSEKYRKNNLIVKVKGFKKQGVITIYQWGTPFMITEIELSDINHLIERTDH